MLEVIHQHLQARYPDTKISHVLHSLILQDDKTRQTIWISLSNDTTLKITANDSQDMGRYITAIDLAHPHSITQLEQALDQTLQRP